MAWHRLPTVLLVCALAAGTVSCGAGSGPGTERDEPPVNLKMVTDLKQLVLPLNSYEPTQAEESRLARAGNVLFRQCMRRFGFEVGEPPVAQPPPFAENERRYGLVDEGRASKIGYDAPEIDQRTRPAEPEMPAAAQAVAEGKGERTRAGQQVPDGGCLGEARRRLAEGTAGADDRLVLRLGDKAGERAEQDSRVRKAFSDWSACMKRAGYDYAGPWQAHDNPEFTDKASGEREIATAVADTRCKRETNLINIWVSVETAYQERLIGSHTEELDRVKSSLHAQLRNADRVLNVP